MKKTDSARENFPLLLSQPIRADGVPAAGIERRLEASAEERAAIAEALDLADLDSLVFTYTLERVEVGKIQLRGELQAVCRQHCVVTLDPVEAKISEQSEIDFWPQDQLALLEEQADEDGVDIPLDGPEPIVDGVIDPGLLAYEIFASNLDPYPRKPGAEFKAVEADPAPDKEKVSPFAALQVLKDKRD